MKRTLALMAAALIAAPFGVAIAEDTAPAADAAAAATTEAAAAVEHTLKDGTKVSVEGDAAFVVAADGTKTPAPDGEHELADGTKLKTEGGKVVTGTPGEGAAEAAVDAEAEKHDDAAH
jgi:hypothetical protein